jgi:hypothetical protein
MNHQRISRRVVAIARVCSLEVLHDNETSQQRADRLMAPHKRGNRCPLSNDLRLIRRLAKGASGSSGARV